MASKSGDSSLHDWFSKSKSSDGKPGWVQLGGKYAGKPCAKQPGQTTKPKCGSSKMKRDLSKDEEEAAFRRKNKKDSNPNRSGKAINVATEETIHEDEYRRMLAKERRAERDSETTWRKTGKVGEKKKGPKLSTTKHSASKAKDYAEKEMRSISGHDKVTKKAKITPGNPFSEAAGEKDACYHKVKSRYKVWPSAYASGALVKCRKKGADNWGNSTKKEGFTPSQIAALESIDAIEINEAGKKCWKGYKKVGTQKLFGKTYNRCEKEEVENVSGQTDSSPITEAVTLSRENGQLMRVFLTFRGKFYMIQLFFPTLKTPTKQEVTDAVQKIYPDARVTQYMRSTIDPSQPLVRVSEQTDPLASKTQALQRKQLMLNRQKLQLQQKATQQKKKTDMNMQEDNLEEVAAWQRKEGKNKEGGLNEKGRKSYERENPGSDLKSPSKKVGNKRRASFCARMSGMKKKLTSAKTANDPDSRINKSLRAWNC